MCQAYMITSQMAMPVQGDANGPSARSTHISRRVAGRRITRESESSSRAGAMSPSSTCWTMWAENRYSSPSASTGEASAATSASIPAAKASAWAQPAPRPPASRRARRKRRT